jgi:hypothetical protein
VRGVVGELVEDLKAKGSLQPVLFQIANEFREEAVINLGQVGHRAFLEFVRMEAVGGGLKMRPCLSAGRFPKAGSWPSDKPRDGCICSEQVLALRELK